MFERKLAERQTHDYGWPSCKAFEDAGCKQCATCPLKGTIKSPLNLAQPGMRANQSCPSVNSNGSTNFAREC